MLTGGDPFRRDSAVGTALAHVRDPAPRLRAVRPDAPARLEAFVARSLAKEPGGRYATAEPAPEDFRARRATGAPGNAVRQALVAAALLSVAVLGEPLGMEHTEASLVLLDPASGRTPRSPPSVQPPSPLRATRAESSA